MCGVDVERGGFGDGYFASHLRTVHAIYEGSVRKDLLGFEELIPPLRIGRRIVKLFKWSNAIWPIASEEILCMSQRGGRALRRARASPQTRSASRGRLLLFCCQAMLATSCFDRIQLGFSSMHVVTESRVSRRSIKVLKEVRGEIQRAWPCYQLFC